ncbi:hypothetical protein J1N35_019039, partial [Gossypium stocksii]
MSLGALETKAEEALIEMMGHVIEQWFDKYVRAAPTSSTKCHDELVRHEETVRTIEATPS